MADALGQGLRADEDHQLAVDLFNLVDMEQLGAINRRSPASLQRGTNSEEEDNDVDSVMSHQANLHTGSNERINAGANANEDAAVDLEHHPSEVNRFRGFPFGRRCD